MWRSSGLVQQPCSSTAICMWACLLTYCPPYLKQILHTYTPSFHMATLVPFGTLVDGPAYIA